MNLFDLCVYKNLNKGSGGDVDVSSLVATENKTYNAGEGKAYNPVVVNVPTPPPSLQSLTASHNGYFLPSSGYVGFDEVTVEVATPLETLSATENGTYTPSSGYEGFSEVTVDVPLPNNAYLLESQKDDVVTIQHGAEFDMPKLIASIEPQQSGSGDPSPTNIRPISGWDECNVNRAKVYQICEPSDSTEITANGVTMTYLGKGKYRVKGTLTANEYTYLNLPIVPFTIYGGDDCYIKLNNSVGVGAVSIIFKNNSSQVDSWGLYPSNRSGSYVGMQNKYTNNIAIEISTSGYGTNFDFTFKVEILSNSTANFSTYNISFGSAGTVYGGKVDVVNGVLTVDRVSVDLGTLNWALENGIFRLDENIGAKLTSDTSAVANMLCSIYKTVSQNAMGSTSTDQCIAGLNWSNGVRVKDSNYTTVADFKTAMSGVQLVYELATPITYQLTPTQVIKSLLGVNNIFADTGEVDVQIWTKEA